MSDDRSKDGLHVMIVDVAGAGVTVLPASVGGAGVEDGGGVGVK